MKYLIRLILIILVGSCTAPSYENTVENISVTESNRILNIQVDTIVVAKDELRIYEIENNVIIAQYQLASSTSIVPEFMTGDFLIALIAVLILGFTIGTFLE